MSSHRDRIATALAVIAALAACKGNSPARTDDVGSARGGSSAPAPAAATPAPGTPAPGTPAPPTAPTVTDRRTADVVFAGPKIDLPRQESFTLLDPGKGERAVLRYALATGTVAFLAQSSLKTRRLSQGAFTRPVELPLIRDGFAITIAAERPGVLALLPLTAGSDKPSLDADSYLIPWRSMLQSRRITVGFDDRGAFSSVVFNDDPTNTRSAQAKDELVQRLLTLIVPVPIEPVAPGASWRVVTILRQGPIYAKQTATFTLSSRSATSWNLHAKLQRVGEEQRISDPSVPGTTVDLIALFRVLEGDVEVDPRQPLIVGGSFAIESRLHVKVQTPGQATTEQIFEDTGTAAFSRQP
jgi:hypothetical protein